MQIQESDDAPRTRPARPVRRFCGQGCDEAIKALRVLDDRLWEVQIVVEKLRWVRCADMDPVVGPDRVVLLPAHGVAEKNGHGEFAAVFKALWRKREEVRHA